MCFIYFKQITYYSRIIRQKFLIYIVFKSFTTNHRIVLFDKETNLNSVHYSVTGLNFYYWYKSIKKSTLDNSYSTYWSLICFLYSDKVNKTVRYGLIQFYGDKLCDSGRCQEFSKEVE